MSLRERVVLWVPVCLMVTSGCTLSPEPAAESAVAGSAAKAAAAASETGGGLRQVEDTGSGVLLVKPDHFIGSYDAFMLDPFSISYAKGAHPLTAAQEQDLLDHLHELLLEAVEPSGLEIRDEPDDCTLRMRLHLAELVILDHAGTASAGSSYIRNSGSVTMIMEYRDSLSREPLVQYGKRILLPGGRVVGKAGSLSTGGLSKALQRLLQDMGVETRRLVPETARAAAGHSPGLLREGIECEGLIAKAGQQGTQPAATD